MSLATRQSLVRNRNTIFQRDSQRSDLLNPDVTQTELIALLVHLCIVKNHIVEFTAIRSDHHDDSGLAPEPPHEGTHWAGWAADCWPLASHQAGDYLDPSDTRFQQFLSDARFGPFLLQIGLAGSAWADANVAAAGSTVFNDDGGDHVHLGTN